MAFVSRCLLSLGALIVAGLHGGAALAAQPTPWGLGPQPAVTGLAEQLNNFNNLLLVIITIIAVFVLGLLVYVMVRFRASANPTPTKTTHNTLIEVLWTAIPVMILVVIAIPSFKLLYAQDVIPETEITVKAIGKQWYWGYEYEHPEKGLFEFDSYMLDDDEAAEANLPRLLATDYAMVLPVDTKIRVLLTASDVIHAFAVPAFGVKKDAVPGRMNEIWFEVREEGTYYGQCSELCGTNHSYMPIMVKVVSREAYDAWLDEAYDEFAALDAPARPVQLA